MFCVNKMPRSNLLNFEAQTLVRGLGDNNHCDAFEISKGEWRFSLFTFQRKKATESERV